jgi:hypothetical protein
MLERAIDVERCSASRYAVFGAWAMRKKTSAEPFAEYEQLRKQAYDKVGALTAKQLRKASFSSQDRKTGESKMQQSNLIAQIGKLFVGTPAEYQKLMAAIEGKSELELERIAAFLQKRLTERSYTKLELVKNGLANTDRNWSLIDHRLGPYYSVAQFRDAITKEPQFKQSLQWDSEPFAQLVQEEQKHHATEQKNFALFLGCAKAATAQGLNVAPNRPNFEMVREAIDDQAQDFNVENVMAMLFRGGLALAPNAPEIAKQLMQQREDTERDRLADIVVDAMRNWRVQTNTEAIVRDEYGRSQALNKLKHLPLQELRSRVEVIENNRALAAKSLEELKAQTEQDRQRQHQARVVASGKPPLPEFNTVTNERMDKAYLLRLANINPSKYRDLVLRHGSHAITLRLNGQG